MVKIDRVRGIDSIRFLLAVWVMLNHCDRPPLPVDKTTLLGFILNGIYSTLFNGPAAVICFFVISGFSIHYPYREGTRPRLSRYFVRRYLRILLPLATIIPLAKLVNVDMPHFGSSILWSIVCEEIYYLLYPFFLPLWRRKGDLCLAVSFLAAIAVTWTNPTAGDYPSYGLQLNWLLGLPCWLLGCRLADKVQGTTNSVSPREIWTWRALAWGISNFLLILRFHTPLTYPHTLNFFAILAYFWLEKEIHYYQSREPFGVMERAGAWSYSIYLVHLPAYGVFANMSPTGMTSLWKWLGLPWAVAVAYLFYRLVEKPSHALARRFGRDSIVYEGTPSNLEQNPPSKLSA